MKQIVAAMLILLNITSSAFATETPKPKEPIISAEAAILVDLKSGQILYSKNPHQKRAIASTTKTLTGILAIELGNLTDIVKVSPKAAATGESTIHLEPEEKLTLEDLLYGALLRSGNDACVAIAEHVAGTETVFVKLMNQKAFLLGAINSNFVNTNGLPNEEHFSTAYDLALIASHALKNKTFAQIVATKTKNIINKDQSFRARNLNNTNKLLWKYPWTTGVKTGTTNKAGKCLIGSASKGDRSLLIVLLHSQNRESDGKELFEYGFNDFSTKKLLEKNQNFTEIDVKNGLKGKVQAKTNDNLIFSVPKDKEKQYYRKLNLKFKQQAPIKMGDKLGEYAIFYNNQKIKSVDLIASEDVGKMSRIEEIVKTLKDFF